MRLRAFLLLLGLACACQAKEPNTLAGKVVGVTDGDTITLLDNAKAQYKHPWNYRKRLKKRDDATEDH